MSKEFEGPDWTPLERLTGSRCCQFMWMWRQAGIEFYKHINTRRYLLLDTEGRCYRQTAGRLEPVDMGAELKQVRGG